MTTHVWALEGKSVLYIEKMNIFRITVTGVTEWTDGLGFSGLATLIPTHGLPRKKQETWTFAANWEYFHATASRVTMTYGGWRIYTDPAVQANLADILAPLPPGKSYLSDYAFESVEGKGLVTAVADPGPIASRVHEFLRNR